MVEADRHRWAVAVMDIGPSDRILDVGCGHGVTVSGVADRLGSGGQVIGIDRSSKMIELAKRRNARAMDDGRAAFVVGSFEHLALGDDRLGDDRFDDDRFGGHRLGRRGFDKIYAFHIADFRTRPGPMFAAARRLLTPAGRLYLFDEIPSWRADWTAAGFAVDLGRVMLANGFRIEEPIVGEAEGRVLVCVVGSPVGVRG